MTQSANRQSSASSGSGSKPSDAARVNSNYDSRLAGLFDEFAAVIQQGDPTQVEKFLEQHSEFEPALREVLPTIRAMLGVPAENPPSDQLEEQRVGDFRLVREVGRGGMGIVYEAEQISIARTVALKILPFASVLDPRHIQRFKNEVQAAAILQHQNIVPVYTVGCERGVYYYAMQFVAGRTLSELIAELRVSFSDGESGVGRSSPSERDSWDKVSNRQAKTEDVPADPCLPSGGSSASWWKSTPAGDTDSVLTFSSGRSSERQSWFRAAVRLMIQAAEALDHAHRRGVLHRDIKPGNLMVDTTGNLWITDFGLARLDSGSNVTMTGDIVGTLRYMSPEQARASHAVVDERADVYSLGATMYELLALRPAFEATDRRQLMRQIIDEEPRRLRKHSLAIPRELETIVRKAMEKFPGDRYASARDMADDLRRFLDYRPILAKPPSVGERIRKWSLRHVDIVWTGLVASLLLVLVLGVATLMIASSRNAARSAQEVAAEQLEHALESERVAAQAAQKAKVAKLQSDALLYAADVRLAADGLENDTVGRGVERLLRQLPKEEEEDRRGFAWYYVWNKLHPELKTLHAGQAIYCLRYSPCGDVLAAGTDSGDVLLFERQSGQIRNRLLFHKQIVRDLEFSADGKLLATASDDGYIAIWEVDRGGLFTSRLLDPTGVMAVQFSKDGETLFAASDRMVHAWPRPWDVPPMTVGVHTGPVYGLAVSPDGSQVAVASGTDSDLHHGAVTIWNVAAAVSMPASVLKSRWTCASVEYSADGKYLGSGTRLGYLFVWNTEDHRQPVLERNDHASDVYDIAYSADGTWLATCSKDGSVRVYDSNGDDVATFQGHRDRVYGIHFSPDSRELASGSRDGTVKLWDPAMDCFSIRPVSAYLAQHVRPSPDGKRMICAPSSLFARIPQLQADERNALTLAGTYNASTAWYDDKRLVVLLPCPVGPLQQKLRPLVQQWGDVDGDGDEDRVAAFGDENQLVWQENLGKQLAPPRLRGEEEALRHRLRYADLKNDGQRYFLGMSHGAGDIAMGKVGETMLRSDRKRLVVPYPTCLDVADINGDGLLDLVCSSDRPGSVLLWMQRPTASDDLQFEPPQHLLEFPDASFVKTLQAKSQSSPDLIAGSRELQEIVCLRSFGNGSYEPIQRLSIAPVHPVLADTVDVDGDGKKDLVVAGHEGVCYFRHDGEHLSDNPRMLDSIASPWARPLMANLAIVNATTQDIVNQFHTYDNFPSVVATSPQTGRIATVSRNHMLRIWDDHGDQIAAVLAGDSRVWELSFGRDGKRLFAAVGDNVVVYEAETLQVLSRFNGHQDQVNSLAVSHRNELVATVSDDLTAKLWSIPTGEVLQNLAGHATRVVCCAFSPDDRLLATADSKGIVKVWDVHTGQALLELPDFPFDGESRDQLTLAFQSPTQLTIWGTGPGQALHAGTWDVAPRQESLKH